MYAWRYIGRSEIDTRTQVPIPIYAWRYIGRRRKKSKIPGLRYIATKWIILKILMENTDQFKGRSWRKKSKISSLRFIVRRWVILEILTQNTDQINLRGEVNRVNKVLIRIEKSKMSFWLVPAFQILVEKSENVCINVLSRPLWRSCI